MKICFKCHRKLPYIKFYRHPQMKDGHLGKCKECTKMDVTIHRAENLERVQAYDRKRGSLPKRVQTNRRNNRIRRLMYPRKYASNLWVSNAIRDGRLVPEPCEVCGSKKVDAHHTDYRKPKSVRWLCSKHHHASHRKYDYEKVKKIKPNALKRHLVLLKK